MTTVVRLEHIERSLKELSEKNDAYFSSMAVYSKVNENRNIEIGVWEIGNGLEILVERGVARKVTFRHPTPIIDCYGYRIE